jgi:hypothetical protein
MSEMKWLTSQPLAAFEAAACCLDRGLVAAREAVIAENSGRQSDRAGVLLDIAAMMQVLKSEGKAVIGLLATSHLAEHRAMAEGCRTRLADAINLHRTTLGCMREGIVPVLPAMSATGGSANQTKPGADAAQTAWAMVWVRAWYLPWISDWQ